MRVALISMAALLALGPAKSGAQTVEEAAAANVALGVTLCWSGLGLPPAAWAQSFRNSGFAETIDGDPANDVTHTFTAPAGTAEVELYYGQTPDYCAVRTDHRGVGDANALIDLLAPQFFPGYMRKVTQGVGAVCVRYEDPSNPIGHVVGVAAVAGADGCAENGTSIIYSSYRV